MSDEYRRVIRRLTTLDGEAAGHRAEAEAWYESRARAVDDKVQAAADAVRDAQRGVRDAQRSREEIDARAAGLWSDFVHRVGPHAERYGKQVPPPAIPHQRDDDRNADDYLQEVAAKVAYTAPARPLTGATSVLFVLFGILGGALGAAANQGLHVMAKSGTGDWTSGVPVVALIALLLGPVIAVAAARRVADRRGAPLDAGAVATVLLSGVATAGLLYTVLR